MRVNVSNSFCTAIVGKRNRVEEKAPQPKVYLRVLQTEIPCLTITFPSNFMRNVSSPPAIGELARFIRQGTSPFATRRNVSFSPNAFDSTRAEYVLPMPSDDWKKEVDLLREQNRLLQEQVKTAAADDRQSQRAHVRLGAASAGQDSSGEVDEQESRQKKGFSVKNVVIGGEGGVAFFRGDMKRNFPTTRFALMKRDCLLKARLSKMFISTRN